MNVIFGVVQHTHTHTHRFIQCSPLVNFMYLFSTRSVWPNVCSHYVILLKYKWDDFIRRKSLVGNGIATTIGYNNTRIEAQPMRFSVSQQLWIENYGVNWYLALIIVSRLFSPLFHSLVRPVNELHSVNTHIQRWHSELNVWPSVGVGQTWRWYCTLRKLRLMDSPLFFCSPVPFDMMRVRNATCAVYAK